MEGSPFLADKIILSVDTGVRRGSLFHLRWARWISEKNAFQTALEMEEIKDFTWHDLRHTFASWLIMKGASRRSVAELLGHRGLRMVMRYAHLSPAYLSAEVSLLDAPVQPSPTDERATKGQRARKGVRRPGKGVEFPNENGSPHWTISATG